MFSEEEQRKRGLCQSACPDQKSLVTELSIKNLIFLFCQFRLSYIMNIKIISKKHLPSAGI